MIDKSELTEDEKIELQRIALEKRKKQLEQEIEDIKLKSKGLTNGKQTLEQLKQYFKDWLNNAKG